MSLRALFLTLIALVFAAPAFAAEQINRFDVLVVVETSGDVVVTETINVTAEGNQIQRGIFRDLPRYFEGQGERYEFRYRILAVTRDGDEEEYETETEENAYRVRIGDPDVYIENGKHVYELRYRVSNQVRYFESYDEIYWNATGNYWAFPIVQARAIIQLPSGAVVTQSAGYTGKVGEAGSAFRYEAQGDRHNFETTRSLQPGEGLTVAIGFEKGLIDPPAAADQGALWWQRNGALAILVASLGGLFLFLYRSWDRVGRDPAKGPVFPRYEAPSGLSPAGVHHVYYRALNGNRALIATLINLAIKGRLTIDASGKKETRLVRTPAAPDSHDIPREDSALERAIFGGGNTRTLGGQYDSSFTAAYTSFQQKLGRKYGSTYFRWNLAYTLTAFVVSAIAFAIAATQIVNWTLWHSLAIVALALLNIVFMYLMPAPTVKGQEVRTEIEGLRLYMEMAEKLQLNAATPGDQKPPMMTKERYERFLPYAVALGVEAPWTKYFEHVLPQEAQSYNPAWSSGHFTGSHALGAVSSALIANMNSGVVSAMPQSSGSSGSGGGGSSGGGGGGGGGGGW
jgi:uncharacterized membrane protein YgcG